MKIEDVFENNIIDFRAKLASKRKTAKHDEDLAEFELIQRIEDMVKTKEWNDNKFNIPAVRAISNSHESYLETLLNTIPTRDVVDMFGDELTKEEELARNRIVMVGDKVLKILSKTQESIRGLKQEASERQFRMAVGVADHYIQELNHYTAEVLYLQRGMNL